MAAALPPELLAMIFTELVPTQHNESNHVYSRDDARAAYRLAAVCKRWRFEALATRMLWTYIYIPLVLSKDPEHWAPVLYHMMTMLERSGQRALDLEINWVRAGAISSVGSRRVRGWAIPAMDVLMALNGSQSRWRCFRMYWNCQFHGAARLQVFGGPTPLLEELVLRNIQPSCAPLFPRHLVQAPKLRVLDLHSHAPMLRGYKDSCLPSLTSLRLVTSRVTTTSLLNLLRCPTLEDLHLSIRDGLPEDLEGSITAISPPVLPALRRIGLMWYGMDLFNRLATSLPAPNLTSLEVGDTGWTENILSHWGSTIRSLTLHHDCSRFSDYHIDTFVCLSNIRSLHLSSYTKDAFLTKFFVRATEITAWPNLDTISFAGSDKPGRALFEAASLAALLAFVRTRNALARETSGVARIGSVKFSESVEVPQSYVDEIRGLC
ncbi:hypothetical protein EXIGLDRAFT_733192 [Exidia glandulosa HHB12029]|uniref:F-box domain-containing protein n=1 Tax=Exidia glandulosa HHB12029 TaxID=1314781 RepID=A0A165KL76_EXIGL|nr:hypothetical protein EXIGLDRAFT_733192 [Exidia glandulosa HHB12029]